jgi:hypothetical protein
MHWVIQRGLYTERDFASLVGVLARFDVPHTVISIDDWTGMPIPDIDPSELVMACGTVRLAKIAAKLGSRPGTFLNENHSHRAWMAAWDGRMLNAAARVFPFGDLVAPTDRVFIRPADDTKLFDGQVADAVQVLAWRDALLRGERPSLTCSDRLGPDSEIICGPVVPIYRESRFFVVDGDVVASTTYRVGTRAIAAPDVDPAATEFVCEAVTIWQPARSFAIDVALMADGYRIVEVNCLNAAGFYGADVQRIVAAVESMSFASTPLGAVTTAPFLAFSA